MKVPKSPPPPLTLYYLIEYLYMSFLYYTTLFAGESLARHREYMPRICGFLGDHHIQLYLRWGAILLRRRYKGGTKIQVSGYGATITVGCKWGLFTLEGHRGATFTLWGHR